MTDIRTNLVTNPSMEAVSTGTVVMRRNLVTNPSFEVDTTGWVASIGGGVMAVSRDTAIKYSGSASLKAVRTSTGGLLGAGTPYFSGSASTTYTVSGYVYSTIASSWRFSSYVKGAVETLPGGTYFSVPAGVWTRISFTFTTLSDTTQIAPQFNSTTTYQTTDAVYFDAVMLEASSTLGDYFDGSTTDALGWDYAWSGTANASISTAACAATTVRTNLMINPSFEATGVTGWAGGVTRVTTEFYSGTASAQFAATASSAYAYGGAAITGGQTYTLSVWVKGESGKAVAVGIGDGTTSTFSSDVTMTGAWQRLSYTKTVAAGATSAFTFVRNGATSGAHTIYFDAVLFEASSTLGDYFDGSFNPAGDFSYAWTGTANASTSIQRGAAVTNAITAGGGVPVQSSSWYSTGSKSLRLIPTLDTTNGSNTRIDVTTVVGVTYTLQVKCRLSAGLTGTLSANSRKVLVYDATTATLLGTSNQAPNNAGTTLLTTTFTATTTTTQIRLFNGAYAGNGDVWWDDLLVEASPIVQDYFDGSVVSADADLTNSWSGTPHASTSIQTVTTRDLMAKKIDYYRTQSGLGNGLALDDYMYAYFKAVSGLPAGLSLQDYRSAFYKAETGYSSIQDGERTYYAIQLGIPDTRLAVDDLRQMFLDSQ